METVFLFCKAMHHDYTAVLPAIENSYRKYFFRKSCSIIELWDAYLFCCLTIIVLWDGAWMKF